MVEGIQCSCQQDIENIVIVNRDVIRRSAADVDESETVALPLGDICHRKRHGGTTGNASCPVYRSSVLDAKIR